MNEYVKHANSIESITESKPMAKGKQRRHVSHGVCKSGRVVAGKFDPSQWNDRLNKSLVACPHRSIYAYPNIHGLLNKKHLDPYDIKPIKSGSVVISIIDGKLRVMDGSECMFEQAVSYNSLSYARTVRASNIIIASKEVKPFGFVSSVFDDNGPVCFWRTLKCDDIVVLIFWGNHEQK